MLDIKDKVVYQIYPKSFCDSNADGIGDLKGVTSKLDYLKELGVDYLWLTPFFVSPQKDNGYDVEDYYNIDPIFGSMEDLEELIEQADQRGMGLMLDMVFNHTSTNHIWFQKALAGDEEYQNYYIFKEGDETTPPTNWISKFGGSAWKYETSLKKWYLHLFDETQADLNWENKQVRKELKDILLFWKKKGIKGFRFDVVNLISKEQDFLNDFKGDGKRFYTDGPRVHEFLKELVADAQIQDMITVGEMSSTTIENCIRYSNPKEEELSMVFSFHHLKIDYKDGDKWKLMEPDLRSLKNIFSAWQLQMQKQNGWNALFWNNHDQPRIVSRLGDDTTYHIQSAKMLAACIHLMRGTPYIYQGEELGMKNAAFTEIDSYRDVESKNYYEILRGNGLSKQEALKILSSRSRDNARTPMQWDETKGRGFSDVSPWIPFGNQSKGISVANQIHRSNSIFSFYKDLIAFRKEEKAISEGVIAFCETNENVFAFERTYCKEHVLVLCNLSKIEEEVKEIEALLRNKKYQIRFKNYENENKISELRPFELKVFTWSEYAQ